jgi:hypothetical protein
MVDNNSMFLYYIIRGKLFKKQDHQMYGGYHNYEKNRGLRLLTKYWVKY